MKLVLKSIVLTPDFTDGELWIDGKFFCFTVEDHYPTPYVKTPGKTAIPAGTYEVVVNMSPKFGIEVPLILGVPNFIGIRCHHGKDAGWSEGCVIVGFKRVHWGHLDLLESKRAQAELTKLLKAAQDRGEKITIDVVR